MNRRPASHYDVVVVGARCAGAATALLLARAGARVALVDRAAPGTDTLSTHAFMRAGVIQLQRWGLLGDVVAAGTPAVRRTVFWYGDRSFPVAVKPYGGVDALYAPRRTVLDPILVDAARAAGADVHFGVSVVDVDRAPGGRVVGVRAHDRSRAPLRIGARIVVGADGIRSTIADAVQAAVYRRARAASAFVYTHTRGLASDGYEWFYGNGATAGLIPTNAGETCAWVGAPSLRFRRELARDVPGAFWRVLGEASPGLAARVADAVAPRQFRTFPGVAGYLRQPCGPGWALVGDAGYFKDPISAHGMSDALRDAEILARAITAALTTNVPEAVALRGYHATRDALSAALFDVTERISTYEWNTTTIEPELRTLSAAMTDEVDYLVGLDDLQPGRLAG
jgi:2-polyprenyl-6-methoxyphenol hydroxylase-like FAD-dependent oxidoreductase